MPTSLPVETMRKADREKQRDRLQRWAVLPMTYLSVGFAVTSPVLGCGGSVLAFGLVLGAVFGWRFAWWIL